MFGKEELMRFMYGFCIQQDKVASFHHFQQMVDNILQYESSVVSSHTHTHACGMRNYKEKKEETATLS
jgi:hypothetical protein